MYKKFKQSFKHFSEALLNSYSIIFFSNNKLLALLLIAVTFFKPFAGLIGLVSVVSAIVFAELSGLNKIDIKRGIYSFNAMIIGIGMGTFYSWSTSFLLYLFIVVIISVIISGVLQNILGKYKLPFLTIPFVLSFWLVLLTSKSYEAIELSTRNIYWINEMYAVGDENLVSFVLFFENLKLPEIVMVFFKSLSSLFFQNNILAGILIAIGILIYSRIMFSLVLLGFAAALFFNHLFLAHPDGINYYLLGGNYILVSIAIGSFYTISSWKSYVWAVLGVAITFLTATTLMSVLSIWGLPIYSMPFSLTVIGLLIFFSMTYKSGLVLTPVQLYSPEKNLYHYLNQKERLAYELYLPLQLPFIGEWMVSQGYNGTITHKGDWGQALDFIIVDEQLKTYTNHGIKVSDFYCYNKPVLAPANGYIQEVIDTVEDNEIGEINQTQNWGNTVIIKHYEGLYSKLSHLKMGSVKVKVGDFVKEGDILAHCGNSGRSPEPHLHFQLQTTPYIESKTIPYPFSSYVINQNGIANFNEFKIPNETDLVSKVEVNSNLKKAFTFLPGFTLDVSAPSFESERWEVFTDALNYNYLYCHETKAVAYFRQLNDIFYFTSFYGETDSLLYYFYTSCYKISLNTSAAVVIKDIFPLQSSSYQIIKWVQDVIAPFYIFRRLHYESENRVISEDISSSVIHIQSKQIVENFNSKKVSFVSNIEVMDQKITSFTIQLKNKNIKVICTQKG